MTEEDTLRFIPFRMTGKRRFVQNDKEGCALLEEGVFCGLVRGFGFFVNWRGGSQKILLGFRLLME